MKENMKSALWDEALRPGDAAGSCRAPEEHPAPFARIRAGDRLELRT
jgi:hypothetical protein